MNRRKFLFNTGIVGAGLLGSRNAGTGLLHAEKISNYTPEEKPMAFTVPSLPYAFNALEPSIDARTMEIHHDKHHGAYVANLNKLAETNAELGRKSPEAIIMDLNGQPEAIRTAVRNNCGGHVNHTM